MRSDSLALRLSPPQAVRHEPSCASVSHHTTHRLPPPCCSQPQGPAESDCDPPSSCKPPLPAPSTPTSPHPGHFKYTSHSPISAFSKLRSRGHTRSSAYKEPVVDLGLDSGVLTPTQNTRWALGEVMPQRRLQSAHPVQLTPRPTLLGLAQAPDTFSPPHSGHEVWGAHCASTVFSAWGFSDYPVSPERLLLHTLTCPAPLHLPWHHRPASSTVLPAGLPACPSSRSPAHTACRSQCHYLPQRCRRHGLPLP